MLLNKAKKDGNAPIKWGGGGGGNSLCFYNNKYYMALVAVEHNAFHDNDLMDIILYS